MFKSRSKSDSAQRRDPKAPAVELAKREPKPRPLDAAELTKIVGGVSTNLPRVGGW